MKRIAAGLVLLVAAQTQAGLFSDDDARKQIVDLRGETQSQLQKRDDRLTQLEAASKRTLEILNQIEKLREEIAVLRGKTEVLQFNQDEAVKRQRDLYIDLDARLRNMESKELARVQSEAQAAERAKQEQKIAQQNAQLAAQQAVEQKQLDEAVGLIKAGKGKNGIAALIKFSGDNPQTNRRAEVGYWMGVGYAGLKDYKAARTAFLEVLNKSADDPRAPDSLLGLASIAAAQKDDKLSRRYLSTLVEKYPASEAAVTAQKALAASK